MFNVLINVLFNVLFNLVIDLRGHSFEVAITLLSDLRKMNLFHHLCLKKGSLRNLVYYNFIKSQPIRHTPTKPKTTKAETKLTLS